jgi:hypothetical protein
MPKQTFKSIVPLPVLERLAGRTRRVYALGTPKSGTTSVAGIFSGLCRTDHEPHRPATVKSMHDHFEGNIGDAQLQQSYRARDKQLTLDLESNCFLAYRPDLLYSTFPDAKFIILIRDPLTWLDSIFDNNINFPREKTPTMVKWHSVLFQDRDTSLSTNDERLIEMGLYPVNCYLDYWVRTYDRCLRSLGDSRYLRIGTNQISRRTEEIGEFIGIDISKIERNNAHKNRTAQKHSVLQKLDAEQIEDSLSKVCKPLIREFGLAELWT